MVSPVINADEVKVYEARAEKGDLPAIFALYRYYKHPQSDDDFEIKAYSWLLKAVELGSEEAMLEMGFKMPYARETTVRDGDVSASIIANCEGIDNNKTNCFLYRVKVNADSKKPAFYTILDTEYKSADNIRPRYLNIVKNAGAPVFELISYNDHRTESRKDYFNQAGAYLGSDKAEVKPDYFYNFNFSPLFSPPVFQPAKNNEKIAEAKINMFPLYGRFVIEEEKRKTLSQSRLNPSFTLAKDVGPSGEYGMNLDSPEYQPSKAQQQAQPYRTLDKDKLSSGIEAFKKYKGYPPQNMPNIIYYGNVDEYIAKAKNGDEYASQLLNDLWANPFGFVYQTPFPTGLIDSTGRQSLDHKLDAIRLIKHPYVSLNESMFGNDIIKILTLCETDDFSPYTEPMGVYSTTGCYAMQIQLQTAVGTKYHYFVGDSGFRSSDIINVIFLRLSCYYCLYGGQKFWTVRIASPGRGEPHLTLYFNEAGDYMFVDEYIASARYMLKSPQQAGPVPFELTGIVDRSTDGDKHKCEFVPLNTYPRWEDLEMEE